MQTVTPFDTSPARVGGGHRRRVVPFARHAPRTSAVVAQVGGGGGRCQAARRAGTQEGAAGRQAGLGVMRVLARAEPVCEVVAPAERPRATRPVAPERDAVGDGGSGGERGRRVLGSRRVDHEDVVGVGDEERGVVRVLVGGVGDPSLAVRLHETPDDLDRLLGAPGAFEAEADQIHADERRGGRPHVVGRRHALVADGHGVLVHAVLGPPQPGRARQQGGVRAGVADAEVLGAERAPRRGAAAEEPRDLHLVGGSVGVLGEHHAPGAGRAQRVAHGRSVGARLSGAWLG